MGMSKRAFNAARGRARPQHMDLGSFAHERRHELPEIHGQHISSEHSPKDALHKAVHSPFYPIQAPNAQLGGRAAGNKTARALSSFGLSDPHPSFARKGDHERDAWFLAPSPDILQKAKPVRKSKEAFQRTRRSLNAQTHSPRRRQKRIR